MRQRNEGQNEIERSEHDVLIENYRTILAELALLTTVSVLLFGFLLTSSPSATSRVEDWVYAAAMVLVASSTMVFVLPVAYHHVQFPYGDFAKFATRSHFWVRVGLPLLATGLYLSLCIAIWPLVGYGALAIATIPFIATLIIFAIRKGEL